MGRMLMLVEKRVCGIPRTDHVIMCYVVYPATGFVKFYIFYCASAYAACSHKEMAKILIRKHLVLVCH